MVRVKVCGITNLDDALAAVAAGADALGFVFAHSSRQVGVAAAREIIAQLPAGVTTVGVFRDAPLGEMLAVRQACGLDCLQLHGAEDEDVVAQAGPRPLKALSAAPGERFSVGAFPGATLLLDASTPGSGQPCDWSLAADIASRRPIYLAGGLGPDNVAQAIATVKPFAVDASSKLEAAPGRKDHAKLQSFIRRAKGLR